MFAAYTIAGRGVHVSNEYATREEAAREILTRFPNLKGCRVGPTSSTAKGGFKVVRREATPFYRYDLPASKITKAQALQMIRDLYRELNTADHETKADWMTHDLAGDRGCALLDTMLTSKAFSDEDRAKFYDTL